MVSITRILVLSDLHIRNNFPYDQIERIIAQENITLIILSGDLTIKGKADKIKSILQEFNQFNLPVFYVPGNMDSKNSTDISLTNIYPIHGRKKRLSGFNFIGLGGSNRTPFFTPFEMSEKEIEEILAKLIETLDNDDPIIFVSHPPPKDTEADMIYSGKHVGSTIVREFIDKFQPALILCGHIHESKSISKINQTICINPGAAMNGNAAIVKIERDNDKKVVIESKLITFQ